MRTPSGPRHRRHASIATPSPVEVEGRAGDPDANDPAIVLTAVEDKPPVAAGDATILDSRSARWRPRRAGRDGRMAPQGAEQKNGTRQEHKTSSDTTTRSPYIDRQEKAGMVHATVFEGVNLGRRSGVDFRRRLTPRLHEGERL